MPPILDVRIFGLPVAQARARARTFQYAGHTRVSMYDPATSRDWKRTVLAQILPHKPPAPVDGPLVLTVVFYLPRPKSAPKRVQYPDRKPDLSNLVKAIEDALNGVVFTDDARLVDVGMSKRYDVAPGVSIRLDYAPPLGVTT